MSKIDLIDEVNVDFAYLDNLSGEIIKLTSIIGSGIPDTVQLTAMSSFASQYYSCIENILKRISKHNKINLPKSEDWHVELFLRFCEPPFSNLPVLFDSETKNTFISLRKARHYFMHGYSFNLKWDVLKQTTDSISSVHDIIKKKITHYLDSLV